MSKCEFCQTESTIIFKCPHCGDRFCKKHRRPENHNCSVIQNSTFDKIPNIKEPFLEQKNNEKPTLKTQIIEQKNESQRHSEKKIDESIEIVKAQSRAVIANLFGTLNDPEDYDEDKKEKYDKIYDYFLKVWEKNEQLKNQIKNMKIEILELKDELEKKNI